MSDSNTKQIKAFNKYFELTKTGVGINDALIEVGKEFDVSKRTLYRWKQTYEWDKRATERSLAVNKQLANDVQKQTDKVVKDFRKPFIGILNKLIAQCVHAHSVKINNVRELVTVMETISKLQKEMDMQGKEKIVSADYNRDKHVKEINGVLKQLKVDSAVDEDGNPKSEAVQYLEREQDKKNGDVT